MFCLKFCEILFPGSFLLSGSRFFNFFCSLFNFCCQGERQERKEEKETEKPLKKKMKANKMGAGNNVKKMWKKGRTEHWDEKEDCNERRIEGRKGGQER